VSKYVYRYEVPVDDAVHSLALTGPVVKIEVSQNYNVVEVWALAKPGAKKRTHNLRAFGTGQEIPDDARYVGTTTRSLGLVWHLFSLPPFDDVTRIPC
jgi:hypothetical protein